MRSNRAFWRALHSLTHPLTIAAVLLLLFNDHWLRWHYPSWLTGKLGDFAWLLFAPLIAAVLLAWIIPAAHRRQERIVGLLAFVLVGLWFALAKTVPIAHHLTTAAWESLIGWPGSLRLDASDLLTLPALLLGWTIWQRAANNPVSLRPLAYVVFALGIVATLANSPAPTDFGLTCITEIDNQLVVVSYGYHIAKIFVSHDGGLNWQPGTNLQNFLAGFDWWSNCPKRDKLFTLADPENQQIHYRFRLGQSIDRSTDGGKTWAREFDLWDLNKDVRRFYHSRKASDIGALAVADPGPFDAKFDQTTGNLIVAMGQDGILLRTPDTRWQWVTVGP